MSDTVSEVHLEFLDALLAGDRIRCTRTVQELMAEGVGLKMLYVQVFQRAMYRVGELWEHQRISVAVEHLATAIVERMLALLRALDAVTAAYSKLPILIGGQALRWGGQKAIAPYPNVTCVASMDELERIITQ